ncbi:hypothetical protein ACC694_37885, partial [Rhizobium ruizarguesonis]
LDLFDSPRNLFVAGFLGSPRMNIINGKVSGVSESGVVIDVGNGGSIVSDVDLAGIAAEDALDHIYRGFDHSHRRFACLGQQCTCLERR